MSTTATVVAYIGGAIFLILFVWKSRDFFNEAWADAKANQLPPKKCLAIAIIQTTLRWLVMIGSFVVFGVTTIKTDSLLAGFLVMAVWVVFLIAIIIKMTRSMPIKAGDSKTDEG